MINKLILLISILLIAGLSFSQTDVVSGNAKSYAGDTLKMYTIEDFITKYEKLIATAVVDKDGDFVFKVNIKEVTQAYIDLTVFKCMMYLQPNRKQTIVLPEKQKILPQDEINPFFRRYEFYPKLINPDSSDLNIVIPMFDKLYNQAQNRILTSQKNFSKAATDEIENKIAAEMKSNDPYFLNYMRYRFAILDYTAYHRNRDIIVKEYFTGKDVLMNNPAYSELFDEMFTNSFANFKNMFTTYKDKLLSIHDKDYLSLRQSLMAEEKVKSETFCDYLILKGIKDAFYSDTFPKETLVALADIMSNSCKTKEYRPIAAHISEDFTDLLIGYPAPLLNITNFNGKKFCNSDFSGKFVYLIFFNPFSYTAQSELSLIQQIRLDFSTEDLEIVLVFVSPDKKSYDRFCNQQGAECEFPIYWYNGDKEMLRKYDVRAFPMYYLISPDGNLSMNPAPGPSEYFSAKFTATFRNWKNEQYRNQYKNSKKQQGIK